MKKLYHSPDCLLIHIEMELIVANSGPTGGSIPGMGWGNKGGNTGGTISGMGWDEGDTGGTIPGMGWGASSSRNAWSDYENK